MRPPCSSRHATRLALVLLIGELGLSQTNAFSPSNTLRVQHIGRSHRAIIADRLSRGSDSSASLVRAPRPASVVGVASSTSTRLWARASRAELISSRKQGYGSGANDDLLKLSAVRAAFNPKNRGLSTLLGSARGSERRSSVGGGGGSIAPTPLSLLPSDPIARFSGNYEADLPKKRRVRSTLLATDASAPTVGPTPASGIIPSLFGRLGTERHDGWGLERDVQQESEKQLRSRTVRRVGHDRGTAHRQAGLSELSSAIARVEARLSAEDSESVQLKVSAQRCK